MSLWDAICLRRDMSLTGRESNKEFISYRIGEADISHLQSKYIERAKRVYRIAARQYIAIIRHVGRLFYVAIIPYKYTFSGAFYHFFCLGSLRCRLFSYMSVSAAASRAL